ncbi:hypothetical protein N0V93_003677 [Gnomoniopsis smithogilvyi]|uniref:Uncharacterized protein n=1 Tax=Gnomoniopsis smithogilvyi TaxID=1191159 RepID=A0A9W8YX41_9PEZI|nr:hypothetical protein N0V93_003677 [Gnomoniopsis smithogilvyi]
MVRSKGPKRSPEEIAKEKKERNRNAKRIEYLRQKCYEYHVLANASVFCMIWDPLTAMHYERKHPAPDVETPETIAPFLEAKARKTQEAAARRRAREALQQAAAAAEKCDTELHEVQSSDLEADGDSDTESYMHPFDKADAILRQQPSRQRPEQHAAHAQTARLQEVICHQPTTPTRPAQQHQSLLASAFEPIAYDESGQYVGGVFRLEEDPSMAVQEVFPTPDRSSSRSASSNAHRTAHPCPATTPSFSRHRTGHSIRGHQTQAQALQGKKNEPDVDRTQAYRVQKAYKRSSSGRFSRR